MHIKNISRYKSIYRNLPDTPGVYIMKNARGAILYVGKAGNLKRRVASYFLRPHDYRIQKLVSQIKKIDYQKTATVIEALILESRLIKKYQPPYNIREKDGKSFLYVEFTREKFPRLLFARGATKPQGKRYGPFVSAANIKIALKILRKIFPYSTHPEMNTGRPCFDYQIGLCPGTCLGAVNRKDYLKNIARLKLIFEGKTAKLLQNLKKEMFKASRALEFEAAQKLKSQYLALKHVRDTALITKEELGTRDKARGIRVEGYDISNISGTFAVGSMVVFIDGEPHKNEYRKFKIVTVKQADDVAMLKEVISRRLKHPDWPLPDLMLIDGGRAQINGVKSVLNEQGLKILVLGIVKGPERKRNDIIGALPAGLAESTLIKVRDEAHRFAISYHRKLRGRLLTERKYLL